MKRVLPLLLFSLSLGTSVAQDRCGFDAQQSQFLKRNPGKTQEKFENWLREKMNTRHALTTEGRTQTGPYQVPVVVHVIHNGEAVGSGTNISDAQIFSQIEVLNEDYKRLNADAANTPGSFLSVAGSIDLEFVLAKQDPDGLPTTGIVRTRGTKAGWNVNLDSNEDLEFKYLSYWPAEDYLNIWVLNITSSYIGYAQFPETNLLQGSEPPYDRLTDGVAVDYQAFGSIDHGNFNLDSQFNKGRTATHEIGHFLGLLHTFQGGCSTQNDFVADTPAQSESTSGCPTHPATSCGGTKMFQNYLDYTDDVCMNLFTNGQVSRMVTILENSPRRKSLLTSLGLVTPVLLTLDLEARSVLAPENPTCSQPIAPKVQVRNRGNSTITSARISFSVNGVVAETKDFVLNLPSLATQTLSFSPVTLQEPSTNTINFSILLVNGTTDGLTTNNSVTSTSVVKSKLLPPFVEAFNATPAAWPIVNSDNGTTWVNTSAPAASSTNTSMYMNFYDYEAETLKDYLASPFIDLAQTTAASLKFDRAYARFPGKSLDSLRVKVFVDCQTDAGSAITIFNAGGSALATANDSNSPFTPNSASQWRTETIPLTNFLGKNIQLVFEATNGYGNNLYLDNVQIVTGVLNDVAVLKVQSPEAVICVSNPRPTLQVQNLGSNTVTRLTVTPKVGGITQATQTFTNLNLISGTTTNITLSAIALAGTTNNVEFSIANPDVNVDEVPANNVLTHRWVINDNEDKIPLRQPMEDLAEWTTFAAGTQQNWQTASTDFDQSLRYPGFTNTIKGEKAWLVSPLLDFTDAIKASVLFDVSYARRGTASENLKVMVSEDCGLSYTQVLYDESGELLAITNSSESWLPNQKSDWRNGYVNLNDYAGKENVRLAFVVTNDNGNNLYLDNIEFFTDDDPTPPRISELYSVYSSDSDPYDFKITFKLPEKETTRVQVYSILGQLVVDETLPETLNQTYVVDMSEHQTGIYIARLQVGTQLSSFKLFVGR